MSNLYIGVDNGSTGGFALLSDGGNVFYFKTPVRKELNYTKTKAWLHRVNVSELRMRLKDLLVAVCGENTNTKVILERPMVNPKRFKQSVSALRALEATLIVLEDLGLPYSYIDSKEWQKALLPQGLVKEELKKASTEICRRLFPQVKIEKDGDGDCLLIAEYLRRISK